MKFLPLLLKKRGNIVHTEYIAKIVPLCLYADTQNRLVYLAFYEINEAVSLKEKCNDDAA
jgi:hypothetical protein